MEPRSERESPDPVTSPIAIHLHFHSHARDSTFALKARWPVDWILKWDVCPVVVGWPMTSLDPPGRGLRPVDTHAGDRDTSTSFLQDIAGGGGGSFRPPPRGYLSVCCVLPG